MATGAIVARILSQYSAKGTKEARKDIAKLGQQFDHFSKRAAQAFAVVGAASAAMALKIGKDAVQAAVEDQKSQALLANNLRNTVGATEDVIASVEKYINKQQLLVGVSDDELRPSLQSLVTATHDVGKAQDLQNLALDIAANRHRDLSSVSIALAKAYAGNFSALKRLGIPLSENLIKSKDFIGITAELAAVTKGAAAAAADTFAGRMAILQIRVKEIHETLGYALLPVLQNFADKISTTLLPQIEAWITANKDRLASSLQTAANFLVDFSQKLFAFGDWIGKNLTLVKMFGVTFAAAFAAGKAFAFATALIKIAEGFKVLKTAAMGASIWTALATGGASIAAGAAALAVFGIGTAFVAASSAADGANETFKKVLKTADQAIASTSRTMAGRGGYVPPQNGTGGDVLGPVQGPTALTPAELKAAKWREWSAKHQAFIERKFQNDQARLDKQMAAERAKQAKLDAANKAKEMATQKALNALKALGVAPTSETDPIQLEAARQNLVKQGLLLKDAETEKQLAQLKAMTDTTAAASRYADVMRVLADGKLTDSEVINLANKWGISTQAVRDYITKLAAAPNIDSTWIDPITGVSNAWDEATKAYFRYLDALKKVPTAPGTGGNTYSGDDSNDRRQKTNPTSFSSPSSTYGSDSQSQGGASFPLGGKDSVAAGVIINVNGGLIDTGGFSTAVQDALQNLNRMGASVSGSASR